MILTHTGVLKMIYMYLFIHLMENSPSLKIPDDNNIIKNIEMFKFEQVFVSTARPFTALLESRKCFGGAFPESTVIRRHFMGQVPVQCARAANKYNGLP